MKKALSYPSRMSEKRSGRPKGSRYPERLLVYCTLRDREWLRAIATDWDTSEAGAVRRLIKEEARRRELEGGAE